MCNFNISIKIAGFTMKGQIGSIYNGQHEVYSVDMTEFVKRLGPPEQLSATAICRLFKKDTRSAPDVKEIKKNLRLTSQGDKSDYKRSRYNIYTNFCEGTCSIPHITVLISHVYNCFSELSGIWTMCLYLSVCTRILS